MSLKRSHKTKALAESQWYGAKIMKGMAKNFVFQAKIHFLLRCYLCKVKFTF